jgi:acyl-CoA thioester hydrolase
LTKKTALPRLFFAPFVSSVRRVEPQWIDYNGHMNMAWYHHLMDLAFDEVLSALDLGPETIETRGTTIFLAETHMTYRQELFADMPTRATVQLINYDGKRIHFWSELYHAAEGWLAARSENMALHVSLETRKVTPFPPEIITNLQIMMAAHSALPRPDGLGRIMTIPAARHTGKPGIH